MKFPGIHMDKAIKETFVGGIAGALIYQGEILASEVVPNYPPILNDPLMAGLPRNGNLITQAAPVVFGLATKKVHKLKKYNNIGLGMLCYSGPSLLHTIIRAAAYQAGFTTIRSQGAFSRVGYGVSVPFNNNVRPQGTPNSYAPTGKFQMSRQTSGPTVSSGIGKYRATR